MVIQLTDRDLRQFILDYPYKHNVKGLIRVTGCSEDQILRVVHKFKLKDKVKSKYSDMVDDIYDKPEQTYTMMELCKKYGFNYISIYVYLGKVGLKGHLRKEKYRHTPKDQIYLIDALRNHPVQIVCEMAKAKGINPCTPQGLYDFAGRHKVKTLDGRVKK